MHIRCHSTYILNIVFLILYYVYTYPFGIPNIKTDRVGHPHHTGGHGHGHGRPGGGHHMGGPPGGGPPGGPQVSK